MDNLWLIARLQRDNLRHCKDLVESEIYREKYFIECKEWIQSYLEDIAILELRMRQLTGLGG